MSKPYKVFRAGKYPQGTVTTEMLHRMAERYDPNYHEAVLNLWHDDTSPALAKVDSVKVLGEELFVTFKDVQPQAQENCKLWSKPSIEIVNYDGEPYLRAVTLTNFPEVKSLDAITFEEKQRKTGSTFYFSEGITLTLEAPMFAEHIMKLAEKLNINISDYSVEGDVVTKAVEIIAGLQTQLAEATANVSALSINLAKYTDVGNTPEKFAELVTERDAAIAQVKELTQKRVDDLLAFGVETRDITPANVARFRKFAETDFDGAKALITSLPAKRQNVILARPMTGGKAKGEHTYEEVVKDPELAKLYSETEIAELKRQSKTFR